MQHGEYENRNKCKPIPALECIEQKRYARTDHEKQKDRLIDRAAEKDDPSRVVEQHGERDRHKQRIEKRLLRSFPLYDKDKECDTEHLKNRRRHVYTAVSPEVLEGRDTPIDDIREHEQGKQYDRPEIDPPSVFF